MSANINIGTIKVINSEVFVKVANYLYLVVCGQQNLFNFIDNDGEAVKFQLNRNNRAVVFTIEH